MTVVLGNGVSLLPRLQASCRPAYTSVHAKLPLPSLDPVVDHHSTQDIGRLLAGPGTIPTTFEDDVPPHDKLEDVSLVESLTHDTENRPAITRAVITQYRIVGVSPAQLRLFPLKPHLLL